MKHRVLLFVFALMCINNMIIADSYKIHRIRKGEIFIAGKKAVEGMLFNENDMIRTTKTCHMTIINIRTEEWIEFSSVITNGYEMTMQTYCDKKREYEESQATKTGMYVPLHGKGLEDEKPYLFLLLDTVHIKTPDCLLPNSQVEIVWKDHEKEMKSNLSLSTDKKQILITKKCFKGRKRQIIKVELWIIDDFGRYRSQEFCVEFL